MLIETRNKMQDIVKLYREAVAAQKLGIGRKVSVVSTVVQGTSTSYSRGVRAVKAKGYSYGRWPKRGHGIMRSQFWGKDYLNIGGF